MKRRTLLGVLTAVGTMVMWWAHGEAATCLQYRTVGGSSVCTKWSTKGVLLEVTYKQPCGPADGEGGGGTACSAVAEAVTTNSIAFCAHPTNPTGSPVKVQCAEEVQFFGDDVGCDPKHDQDDTGEGGKGHDKGKHGCKATILLTPPPGSCNTACASALLGPALDVTPITMDTNVAVTVVPSGEGGGGATSPCTFTDDYGYTPSCTFTEHCSINPNKIEFEAIRPYQCKLTSAGGPPPDFPSSD
jgi:hypothetical protein